MCICTQLIIDLGVANHLKAPKVGTMYICVYVCTVEPPITDHPRGGQPPEAAPIKLTLQLPHAMFDDGSKVMSKNLARESRGSTGVAAVF